jgi:hypothetical protein
MPLRYVESPGPVKADMEFAAEQIDRLLTVEIRTYGGKLIDTVRAPMLYEAAYKKMGKSLTLKAAEELIKVVKPDDTVLISTGWVLPPRFGINWLTAGENDGISGSVGLADAIIRGLGAKVVFLTEKSLVPVLEGACKAAAIRTFSLKDVKKMPKDLRKTGIKVASVQSFPTDNDEAKKTTIRLLDTLKPSAIITVEKSGRNTKGVYHTGLGRDMSETTAKVDLLVDEMRSRGILTIGIGDRGNEIGMGVIEDTVRKIDPQGSKCECPCKAGTATMVKTDVLALGSCSNTVPFGIAAVLSGLLRDPMVLQSADTFRRVLAAGVQAGALCGARMTPSLSVHGLDVEVHVHFLEIMRAIVSYEFTKYYAENFRP